MNWAHVVIPSIVAVLLVIAYAIGRVDEQMRQYNRRHRDNVIDLTRRRA